MISRVEGRVHCLVVCGRSSSILRSHMLWGATRVAHVLRRRGTLAWHGHVASHRLPWWASHSSWWRDSARESSVVLRGWCFAHQVVIQR